MYFLQPYKLPYIPDSFYRQHNYPHTERQEQLHDKIQYPPDKRQEQKKIGGNSGQCFPAGNYAAENISEYHVCHNIVFERVGACACPLHKQHGQQYSQAEGQEQFFDYSALFRINPFLVAGGTYRYGITGGAPAA